MLWSFHQICKYPVMNLWLGSPLKNAMPRAKYVPVGSEEYVSCSKCMTPGFQSNQNIQNMTSKTSGHILQIMRYSESVMINLRSKTSPNMNQIRTTILSCFASEHGDRDGSFIHQRLHLALIRLFHAILYRSLLQWDITHKSDIVIKLWTRPVKQKSTSLCGITT
jgi:hypothetical protein